MFTVSSPFERLHSWPFLFPSWVLLHPLCFISYLTYVLQSFLVRVIFSPCYFSSILCQPCFFLVYCCLFCVLYTVFYRTYILQSFIICFSFLHSTPTFFLFGFLSSHFFFSYFFSFLLNGANVLQSSTICVLFSSTPAILHSCCFCVFLFYQN